MRSKREADFTIKLQKWIKHFKKKTINAIEVKVVDLTKAKRPSDEKFYYSKKPFPKELRALRIFQRGHFIYKFPDTGYGTPFDIISIGIEKEFKTFIKKSYLIIQYWQPRVKHFYVIEIDAIEKEIKKGEVSLSESCAAQIGRRVEL